MLEINVLFHFWWVLPILALIIGYRQVLRVFGVVIIPNDSIGLVNKKFVLFGENRTLPDGKIVAMNGEAGIQADTLAPGVHYFLWPWQYDVIVRKFVQIDDGKIGVVSANDGVPLPSGRILGSHVDCDYFQDARKFLMSGGQRGSQITIIPPGSYRINTELFLIEEHPVRDIPDNKIGIVTTKEGTPLKSGEIAGGEIPGHLGFQNGQKFLDGGGTKGLQEQVILSGRYFINPLFAEVNVVDMTQVPIANVGVVISYVGPNGKDVTGDTFKHGNLVDRGCRGVWADPLDPGKYPINPFTHKVEVVPTANVVLNWANTKSESHKLDERLSTITVRSSDGFKFNLDVSQIIHIPRNDAPKVIARFGNMGNLVTQVLEPTIGNYFRNTAQKSDVIAFLKERSQRQDEAKASIVAALHEYNVNGVDTLIGDIVPPDDLMKTLTDRKLAEQGKITYETQKLAEETRKDLQQAKAMAETQAGVVESQRSVDIAEYQAKAAVAAANGNAQAKTINAEADAKVTTLNGDAEAGKILAIGRSEAEVVNLKVASMEAGNFASVEVTKYLAQNNIKLVPEILVNGGNANGGGLVDVLLANLVRDNAKGPGKMKE